MSASPRPPISLTSLVGRESEIRDLGALIAAQRLVTLTGVGGSGKTRLAAELALRVDWQRADSVVWVELGPCTHPELVAQQVAAALALRDATALVDALRERELLIVLDNCEHVVAACAELATTLLRCCPKLRILATSREPLGVAGERVWPVPPIAESEAIELFAERAAAVDPSFALHDANRAAVAEICRRLDGIPLAIELAAARVRVLTPEQMTARLADRFSILSGGARDTVPRHRTLRAAIDWSFALLNEREQTLLAQLSVFRGSFSLEAVEAVCAGDVLDLLSGLVDKSLVVANRRRGAVRYSLLETIREYAAERLGNAADVRRRHAEAFLAIAREAVPELSVASVEPMERLDPDHDNVRAALAWSLEHEPDALALPLAAAFRWYWYYRILWSEGLRWLTLALERAERAEARPAFAVALTGAGVFSSYLGDLAAGREKLEEAEALWRALGDDRELAFTLAALAQTLASADELDTAEVRAAEAVALARSAGTPWDLGYALTNGAAFVAQRRGELEEADRALEEAEAIWSPSKHPLGLPFVLNARALLALRRRDEAAAARFARAALVETRPRRDLWFSARSLRILAFTSTNDLPRAARLLGAADAMLRAIGTRMLVHENIEHERLIQMLDSEELQSALKEGATLTFDQATELALAEETRQPSTVNRQPILLHISDLGPLKIELSGKPLASEGRASNRARELLVFLAVHPPGPTKEEVGVAFWPDATTEQVKNSFHVTLHRLRKLLGGADAVVADGARYLIGIPHIADSRRFETEMAAALRKNDVPALEAALALHHGDFLQGEDAGEWCLPIRARLRQLHLRGLFALGQAHEARGRYTDAAETYTRVVTRDPFHEPAARQLMICRARLGERSTSLSVYRELEQRLREDLQAAPEPETATLYRRLRQNEAV
ncbi:MAG TPA: BTAD domain-containing putative transcriptional regulator [Thermoanaerobaculia bacterium]|nr:BTAD domain-containing putative transcriptional regulator [Thermoanaerobaculia bacterium]